MPAIITHHVFGLEIHADLADLIGRSRAAREAFLLGNIGPDPLFCLKPLPKNLPYRKIGWIMHERNTNELLGAFHRHFIESNDRSAHASATNPVTATIANTGDAPTAENAFKPEAPRAYALGFLCHYLLDSIVHPLVYAQQHSICKAGIGGIDERYGGTVHAMIETVLDEYVLTQKAGTTVARFSPSHETLRCPAAALAEISSHFPRVVKDAYGIDMPLSVFASSVLLYRAVQRTVDSKRDGLRSRFDYARIVGKHYPHLIALTHMPALQEIAPFCNEDHVSWPHPFEEGGAVNSSFAELYEHARSKALELLPEFARADFPTAEYPSITEGVNFKGAPLQESLS